MGTFSGVGQARADVDQMSPRQVEQLGDVRLIRRASARDTQAEVWGTEPLGRLVLPP